MKPFEGCGSGLSMTWGLGINSKPTLIVFWIEMMGELKRKEAAGGYQRKILLWESVKLDLIAFKWNYEIKIHFLWAISGLNSITTLTCWLYIISSLSLQQVSSVPVPIKMLQIHFNWTWQWKSLPRTPANLTAHTLPTVVLTWNQITLKSTRIETT